jgi:DNA-binding NarL/FixJ family response regulator
MFTSQEYLLVLGQTDQSSNGLQSVLSDLGPASKIAVANSIDQAMTWINQHPPYLLIVTGEHHGWFSQLVQQCRHRMGNYPITIVALTHQDAPTWIKHEKNPGFDGFLVEPINGEILQSLIQWAQIRQACSINAEMNSFALSGLPA